jgi:uncharacterized protein
MALKPVTLITGASAGIGAALARKFAAKGHELVLVARREAELATLADEIAAKGRPRPIPIPLDLTRVDAPIRVSHELSSRGLEPAIVVNNAGFGLLGYAAELDRAQQLEMIDLNIRALTDLSLRYVDSLARHKGGILNVGSVAGFFPGAGMAIYYASKAYVLSFSEALHRELAPRGVRVSVLCPGPVPTEFQARAGMGAVRATSFLGCTPEEIADAAYDGFMAGKRVILPDLPLKFVPLLPRLLPRWLVLALTDVTRRIKRPEKEEKRWPRKKRAPSP